MFCPPFFYIKDSVFRGKKQTINLGNSNENANFLTSRLANYFDKQAIEKLAKATNFIQRKSKLTAFKFLNTLMFVYQQGKELSLLDMCSDLYVQYGIKIKKQSLHERFNKKAVAFMKDVLHRVLESQFEIANKEALPVFNRIRIKDSTRFALPAAYAQKYQGHGGAIHNGESLISIQYEYDLLSGNAMDLRLTNGRRNDQLDAKENTHDIVKNDLFLRDLGYATLVFLSQIIEKGAYFLNRLNSQFTVYYDENPKEKIDFKKCTKQIKKQNLHYLEYNVLVGKKEQIPCRLIMTPVDEATYERRIRKAQKSAKSKGYQLSEEFKIKARLTCYITNTEKDKIPACEVKKVYSLRWQIELTFKVWKSQAKVDKIKEMNIYRFECQLMAKLIWLLIHKNIFKYLTHCVNDNYQNKSCSIWKYYKHAYRINDMVRKIINKPNKLKQLLESLTDVASWLFLLEQKNGKTTHYQALKALA